MTEATASGTPTIRLAGRDWAIPVLSIKQNRVVIPAFMKFMSAFSRISAALAARATDPTWFMKIQLTTEEFDTMCDAVYGALLKATPGLARNEFDSLEISLEDLFSALPVIATQTGIMKPVAAAPAGEDSQTGEAVAGSQSTSTSSSPISAPAQESVGPTN